MKIITRNLTNQDYQDLKSSMIVAYQGLGGQFWDKARIDILLDIFPEGQLCIEVNSRVVACALSLVLDYTKIDDVHTYREITGNFTFSTHDPKGNVLYGIEVFVHPDFRGLRLGRRLYEARKELCERLNLKSVLAGGRIPNYHAFSNELSPRQYIDKVKQKEIFDPVLTFQLSNDFHVSKILTGYLPGDHESKEFATLLEWNNIYYQPKQKSVSPTNQIIRLGLVQWQMRLFDNVGAFYEQVRFFVDAVSGYSADFLLFPEFFNVPLMAPYNDLPPMEAMKKLAGETAEIKKTLQKYAISYNVNIISSSMPLLENSKLYNVSYLCHRNGKTDEYRKVHITPNELKVYGMQGGDVMPVFDTDCGKVAIAICYDVEFPELCRIYAEQGVQILFVPFLTSTQNGYTRVHHCAQTRAIENECYVAIAGCVGNLPRVNNMDIQFAQSAVFTPSDFAFPPQAIKAEATPNTEMVLVADVDLNSLRELHQYGTVKLLQDRRKDLYRITMLKEEVLEKV